MNKYELLFILNIPFVIFGVLKAVMGYRTNKIDGLTFALRMIFWAIILFILIFAKDIYTYLFNHGLTDSTPLSLPDVVIATGLMLVFSLTVGLYSKFDQMNKRISDLHEKISIYISEQENR